jgi:K+-transporting ATPase c subunit
MATMGPTQQTSPVPVVVLHTLDCPATPPTIDMIRRIATDLGVEIDLHVECLESQDQAQQLRFVGSPTVQVLGVDIDPAARSSPHFGLG